MAQIEQPANAPAQPQAKASIEERIAAAVAPPPTEEAPSNDEAVRESPERRDPEPAATAEAQAGAATGEPEAGRESADAGEGERQEPNAVEIGTLAELAEHVGVEAADLYHITVPIDVDGKREEFSIGEFKDKIRAGVESEALAEQRKAFADEQKAAEEHIAARRQQAQQAMAEAAVLTEAAEKRLMSDLEGIDWAELRGSNPAEWAAKQQEVQQRQAQIQASKQELARNWQAQSETMRAEQAGQLQEHLGREREALLQAVPEWRDEGAFDTERKSMREYLSVQGFADAEIDNATDHRLIVMARKARLYDEQSAKASVATKKVAKVGKKILKPGTTAGKQVARDDALAKLRTNVRKSGKVDDVAAYLSASRKR